MCIRDRLIPCDALCSFVRPIDRSIQSVVYRRRLGSIFFVVSASYLQGQLFLCAPCQSKRLGAFECDFGWIVLGVDADVEEDSLPLPQLSGQRLGIGGGELHLEHDRVRQVLGGIVHVVNLKEMDRNKNSEQQPW